MLGKAIAENNRRICYIAPTFQQARDIAWETLKTRCAPAITSANETRLELTLQTVKGGESKIFLRGWEAVDTLRGQFFDFLVLDEIREMRRFEVKWEEVLRPTLVDKEGEGLFISTPNGYDHFYKLCMEEQTKPEYKSFHFTTYDNPHIPLREIEMAKATSTEDSFWQEYMADFRKFVGLIYKEFQREIHVIPPQSFPTTWQFYRSMDFGAHNPTVCLWEAVSNTDEVYIFDEYGNTHQTTKFHANVIQGKTSVNYPVIMTYGDPSGNQAMLDYTQEGLIITPATKFVEEGKGWVKSGINKVAEMLKPSRITNRPRLYITSNCVNTIREFENYRWMDKKASGEDPDQPLKVDDHWMDAIRYFAVSYNSRDFRQYNDTPSMQVNSFTGYKYIDPLDSW